MPKEFFKPEMLISGVITANLNKYSEDIVVPKSAVLWTGKRSIVYVKDGSNGHPIFTLREVTFGSDSSRRLYCDRRTG